MSELLLSCILLRECEASRLLIPTPLESSFAIFFPNLTSKRGEIKSEMLQGLIFDWQLVSGFLFFLPLLLFLLPDDGRWGLCSVVSVVKANGRGGAGAERGGVFVRERLGCADGEVGGRGGGSDPIHISRIWPENELVLFFH